MNNKSLFAIFVGITTGLLVLAIAFWLYWVKSHRILPFSTINQIQPVLAQLTTKNEWETIEPIYNVDSKETLDTFDSTQELMDSHSLFTNQVKGISTDFMRPDCVVKEISKPELGLSWRYQTCQNEQVSYRVDGNQVIEVVTTPSANFEQVVIEVMTKLPDETMEEVLKKKYISRLTEVARAGCQPQRSQKVFLLDKNKETWELLPVGEYQLVAKQLLQTSDSAQPCGTYGYTLVLRYFEYHPQTITNRYIFVQGNLEETYFDRNSLVLH